jgi:anti-sigma factor ChrR (cupin superfamily)
VSAPVDGASLPFASLIRIGAMELHADLSQRALHDTNALAWMPSPMAEVERRFARHGHGGGDEILVLDGVFQDEHGSYPDGSWLRNPPGSVPRPWSEPDCTIWVKTGHLPVTLGPDWLQG